MDTYRTIDQIAANIKKSYEKLSDFEALTIAAQIQRNEILTSAFCVHKGDKHPSALEAIAMKLGHESNG